MNNWNKSMWWFIKTNFILLTTITLLFGCGGSGGGSDSGGGGGGTTGGGDPPPPLPNVLNYAIATSPTADNNFLTFTFPDPEGDIIIPLIKPPAPNEFRLTGTYNTVTKETTLNSSGNISADTQAIFGTNITTGITEEVRWFDTEFPIQGAMFVFFETETGTDFIALQVIPDADGLGAPGVSLRLSGDAGPSAVSFTWEEFINIVDDPAAEQWQIIAYAGYSLYDLLFRSVAVAFDNFVFFVQNNRQLETAGTAGLSEACDVFPPSSGAAGSRRMVWNDADNGGDINPGDGFTVTYTNCWSDDPADDIDEFFRGSMQFAGYIENATPYATGGDFLFTDFRRTETEQIGGVFQEDIQTVLVTTGGYNIFLSTP